MAYSSDLHRYHGYVQPHPKLDNTVQETTGAGGQATKMRGLLSLATLKITSAKGTECGTFATKQAESALNHTPHIIEMKGVGTRGQLGKDQRETGTNVIFRLLQSVCAHNLHVVRVL